MEDPGHQVPQGAGFLRPLRPLRRQNSTPDFGRRSVVGSAMVPAEARHEFLSQWFYNRYPLVNIQKAMENGHWNSEFSH